VNVHLLRVVPGIPMTDEKFMGVWLNGADEYRISLSGFWRICGLSITFFAFFAFVTLCYGL
jgi:hypothetical protein